MEPKGILFDLDGTIYEAGGLIPGALDALRFCEDQDISYRFVTNTTSKPREEIATKLRELGLNVKNEWIFTAPAAAREILIQRGFTRCYFLLRPALLEDFPGIESVSDAPDAVVVGDLGADLSFDSINRAFRLLIEGRCAFITLALNRFFRVADGLNMDVGAFVAALEYASGRKSELVGKPAPAFFHAAVESMKLQPAEVVMIGDDLESDALGAQAAGLRGVLVRTGKFRAEALAAAAAAPDAVWSSVADLAAEMGHKL